MNSQILKVGIYNGILLCLFLEFMAVGDFLRSARMGSTMIYWFWLFVCSGILMRIIVLRLLWNQQLKKSLIIGVFELTSWVAVQGYLLLAIYFKTEYAMSVHGNIGYVYEVLLFTFGVVILIENSKSHLLRFTAILFLIFSGIVGIEYFTKTSFNEYFRFLDPLPIIGMILLVRAELKKNPISNQKIIDDVRI